MSHGPQHVHWVGAAIQPSHPLWPSSSSALSLSQHQGLSQCVDSSQQVAKASVLPMNIQDWFPLGLTSLISLQSKQLSRVFSSSTIWKQQFFRAQPLLYDLAVTIIHDYRKKCIFDYTNLCHQSDVSAFWHAVYVCPSISCKEQTSQFHDCSHCSQWIWRPRK